MDDMYLDSACCSWQIAMKSLGRKKKNWASLCHGRHAFNLFTCRSWQSAMKILGKKIGQHSAMDGMHLDCAWHSWQSAMKSLLTKNWSALCYGQHAFRLRMPFMAECHEEFVNEKLVSTLLWTACI